MKGAFRNNQRKSIPRLIRHLAFPGDFRGPPDGPSRAGPDLNYKGICSTDHAAHPLPRAGAAGPGRVRGRGAKVRKPKIPKITFRQKCGFLDGFRSFHRL